MSIYKIVLTGGPCGGKSNAMKSIIKEFESQGYKVLIIPETATELISGGIAPWTVGDMAQYETYQMRLQMEKEKVFEEAAAYMIQHGKCDKVLIVCDRGVMDIKAYVGDGFEDVLMRLDLTEEDVFQKYDAVFHLVTTAKGAEEFYTTDNNSARTETLEEAAALDDRIIDSWSNHPYCRVIDNSSDFEGKMNHLLMEISEFLS